MNKANNTLGRYIKLFFLEIIKYKKGMTIIINDCKIGKEVLTPYNTTSEIKEIISYFIFFNLNLIF